jgi:hypothetical protein
MEWELLRLKYEVLQLWVVELLRRVGEVLWTYYCVLQVGLSRKHTPKSEIRFRKFTRKNLDHRISNWGKKPGLPEEEEQLQCSHNRDSTSPVGSSADRLTFRTAISWSKGHGLWNLSPVIEYELFQEEEQLYRLHLVDPGWI